MQTVAKNLEREPAEGATVAVGAAVTFSSGQLGGSAPTFQIASLPSLIPTPDIDSSAGSPNAPYQFASTKATTILPEDVLDRRLHGHPRGLRTPCGVHCAFADGERRRADPDAGAPIHITVSAATSSAVRGSQAHPSLPPRRAAILAPRALRARARQQARADKARASGGLSEHPAGVTRPRRTAVAVELGLAPERGRATPYHEGR